MRHFVQGLKVQTRVIGAIISREMGSRHGEGLFGLLWLLIEPILIILVVVGIHEVNGQSLLKYIPVVALLLTGYVPHLLYRHAGLAGVSMLYKDSGLLYHREIHFFDLIVARLFLETLAVLLSFAAVYFIFYLYGQIRAPYSIAYIYLGWMYHIWFIFGSAFFFTGLGIKWDLVRRLFVPLTLIMLPVYAAFFLLAWMSPTVRYYLLLFPPANATEMMRYGIFGDAVPTFYNIPYTTEACIVWMFIGLMCMFHFRKELE